ncbi:MAG: NAD(P)/FAD-dependent oxidoreductase [Phycisphaerae bacterium]
MSQPSAPEPLHRHNAHDQPRSFDLMIIGSGAAGMMGAVAAADRIRLLAKPTATIAILEKNSRPGIKVLVCGGGRCNLTNAGSLDFLIGQFGRNGRFLTPALQRLDNTALRQWFADRGVPTHEEHDGKIYPDSNQAASIVNTLVQAMHKAGVAIFSSCPATAVAHNEGGFLVQTPGRTMRAVNLLICCGGQSYTRMGTTGDGYQFAAALGHQIVTPRPAVVPLLVKEAWVTELQGLAVRNVKVAIEAPGPLPRLATGKPAPSINDMLFTHFGLSGPAVLNLSEIVAELLEKFSSVGLKIDFSHHISSEEWRSTFARWRQTCGKKLLKTLLSESFPVRLTEMFLRLAATPDDTLCSNVTSAQTHRLIECIKNTRFEVIATRGFKEAMVTAGGVRLDEVDPRTMESRICRNLFLAGEVLDLTGPSGGYNLQLAFSTGYLAGESIADRITQQREEPV